MLKSSENDGGAFIVLAPRSPLPSFAGSHTMISLLLALSASTPSAFFPATSPLIRTTGRTVANGTALYADWSSVYLEFAAVGPLKLAVVERWGHGNEYAVTVGAKTFQLNTMNATSPTSFDLGLAAGVSANVRVEKVTEPRTDAGGLVKILGVSAAKLLPLPPAAMKRTKKVVCIGDSIMCGCHSECHAPYPDQCPMGRGSSADARESSRLSWCTVVARAFDADYQVFCESGSGLIMTDGDECHAVGGSATCIPEKMGLQNSLGKAAGTHGALDCLSDGTDKRGCTAEGCDRVDPKTGKPPVNCMVAANTPAKAFDADVFLVNLGQNDYGKPAHIDPKTGKPVKSHLPTAAHWVKFYTEFVANLTASESFGGAGDASSAADSAAGKGRAAAAGGKKAPEFFLAVGGMADKYMNNTKLAVAHMNSLGNKNVHLLDITGSSTDVQKSYLGCGGHPSWIGHQKAANISIPLVAKALGWTPGLAAASAAPAAPAVAVGSGACPGGTLAACMALCPTSPPVAYKTCVDTCVKNCGGSPPGPPGPNTTMPCCKPHCAIAPGCWCAGWGCNSGPHANPGMSGCCHVMQNGGHNEVAKCMCCDANGKNPHCCDPRTSAPACGW